MNKVIVKRVTLTKNVTQTIALDSSFHSFIVKNFSTDTPILISFQNDVESVKIPALSYQVISMSEDNSTARYMEGQ